ncbi:MAG: glycosyltransferase, partial [Petrimonas sp.]|nr:glycosyltransferase [Petrimonas sp.]
MAGGGAERQLTYLVKEQLMLGHDAHVVLCAGGPNFARLRATGATIHFLKGRGNHDPRLLIQLYLLVGKLRPDIVQTWILQMDILGGLCAKMLGIPFILSERSSEEAYPQTLKWALRKRIAKWSAGIIANSSGGARYWNSILPQQHECFVVPNAVPVDEIRSVEPHEPDCPGLPEEVPRILFVGRLSAEKRIDLLLEAFNAASDRTRSVLILCGQGEEEGALRQRVYGNNRLRTRVFFLSYQMNVWSLMKNCQLFVSLSSFEGSPNAVIEAAACGLQLLLSDIPAHRETIGDDASYVSDNIEEIAERMVGL